VRPKLELFNLCRATKFCVVQLCVVQHKINVWRKQTFLQLIRTYVCGSLKVLFESCSEWIEIHLDPRHCLLRSGGRASGRALSGHRAFYFIATIFWTLWRSQKLFAWGRWVSGLPDFSLSKHTKTGKVYVPKWPQTILNSHILPAYTYQMAKNDTKWP
jgi:hypothetical protein